MLNSADWILELEEKAVEDALGPVVRLPCPPSGWDLAFREELCNQGFIIKTADGSEFLIPDGWRSERDPDDRRTLYYMDKSGIRRVEVWIKGTPYDKHCRISLMTESKVPVLDDGESSGMPGECKEALQAFWQQGFMEILDTPLSITSSNVLGVIECMTSKSPAMQDFERAVREHQLIVSQDPDDLRGLLREFHRTLKERFDKLPEEERNLLYVPSRLAKEQESSIYDQILSDSRR